MTTPFVAVGPTEIIVEVLCGPRQHDAHCRGWRWHLYTRDNSKRMDAVADEMRKMLAERREDEARAAAIPQQVSARFLQPGDVVGSGETIVSVSAGARTPRGKVEVTLEKDGRRRTSIWGAYTLINVRRAA